MKADLWGLVQDSPDSRSTKARKSDYKVGDGLIPKSLNLLWKFTIVREEDRYAYNDFGHANAPKKPFPLFFGPIKSVNVE